MKAYSIAGLLGLCAVGAAAPGVTLQHVRGGVYLAVDTFYVQENSVVYVGPKHVTVVGATWTPETAKLLVSEIRKVTSKPVGEVIVPDYHADRSGGSPYFRSIGAKVVSRRQTVELLRERWAEHMKELQKAYVGYPAIPLTLPDIVHEGDFELQGGKVRAIYTGPAHTPDGVFVFFPEERILYGNCILKERLGNLDSADVAEYPKTLEKLKAKKLGYTTIIAGHFTPLHGPDLVEKFLQMLEAHGRPGQ
ncbi:MAG: subclass B2 metallo-beta-lactamase [Bryobacterales bacterium]|nr:subclass B2 metallo-beta-lactamase [Bryobacterales bacterium]